ncbi:ABC transporter ATP-binding protein [Thermospira aquatica]|uniref:ABC transporter ATP-binding protein n=1 Tax=Thermospira aquatica TaxID=2828656 RepID=A0AAX3BG05_9SPIR|nr:ABC transporter ATP-binding protein [Thermospira aquatica]URA11278.1 ABC transporter ATP-binding protein [Thermospira aquatica]
MPDVAIEVQGVSKSYDQFQALKNVSFSVYQGECYALLGPNGAGKTTMMKLLYGRVAHHPANGQIRVFGLDSLKDSLKIRFFTGIVPQDDNLDYELSVQENLRIYSLYYGMDQKTIQKRIDELLEFMDLRDKKNANIRELSGGMRRRLVIARALLHSPRLLILDEPTTGLDPQVRHHIWDKLRVLLREGVTILLTTHYMDEAFQLADRLMILHEGVKIVEGKPAELIRSHIEPYVYEVPESKANNCTPPDYVRLEKSGEMVRFYAHDVSVLQHLAECLPPGTGFIRQANLEDVFLKLTGRQLHE